MQLQAQQTQALAQEAKTDQQPIEIEQTELEQTEIPVLKKRLSDAERENLAQELIAEEEAEKVKKRKKSISKK